MTVFKIKWHVAAMIKKALYKILFGKKIQMGGGTTFRSNFHVYLERGAEIKIGRDCFFNNDCSLNALDSISIGDGCIFGENVKLYDHNHKFSDLEKSIKEQGYVSKPIKIGNHCWFGANVTILQGVQIGDHCTIGANCLIYKNVESNTVVMCDQGLVEKHIT